MTVAVVGSVESISADGQLTLVDFCTKMKIKGRPSDALKAVAQVGQDGVFVGQQRGDQLIEIHHFEPVRLLKPLFERDLMRTAGETTFVAAINKPFLEAFHVRDGQLVDVPYDAVEFVAPEPEPEPAEDEDSE